MATQAWQTAVSRWGDALWQLALLLHDDGSAARAATVRAFAYTCATPSADLEATLVQALLRQRPRWQHPLRRHILPRSLAHIAPFDRVLLALWLVHNMDGPRLAALIGAQPDTLAARLAAALAPMLPRYDPAHTPAGRAVLAVWLAQQLEGVASLTPPATGDWQAAQVAWQTAVEHLRALLQTTVSQHHLPLPVQAAIEVALSSPLDAEPPSWWQRQPIQLGGLAAGLVLLLLLVIAPWGGQAAPPTVAASLPSQELVQQTLDNWATLPISGTLHRRVWAVDERLAGTPVVMTDLWLDAKSPRHRVEVRQNDRLVEWQLADGTERLRYATDPGYSACPWQDSQVLDHLARTYQMPREQQQAVRDARLTLGAYGAGYRFLQAALAAPDLRSLGTRMDGDRPLVLLSYTDQRMPSPRYVLLSIDSHTYHLQAVREVVGEGVQTIVRDLWRLEAHEVRSTGVSLAAPRWPSATLELDQVLDPACPGLDPDHVVSLRVLMGSGWVWHLPNPLPSGITRAALLTPSIVTENTYNVLSSTRAIFVGPDRWLSLSPPKYDIFKHLSDSIQRGPWYVKFVEDGGLLNASICRHSDRTVAGPGRDNICPLTYSITARGWTHSELLALIDSLTPVNTQTWDALDKIFLDGQPLKPQARKILRDTLAALQPRKEGTLYSASEQSMRVNPDRPTLQDPYHVPPEIRNPDRFILQQWLVYSDTELVRFKQLHTTTDGTLISAEVNDGSQYVRYNGAYGQVTIHRAGQPSWWISDQQIPANEMIMSLISRTMPITLTHQADSWLLEQPLGQSSSFEHLSFSFPLLISQPWMDDLPQGTLIQRISIDRVTSLPHQAVVVHVDQQGHETILGRMRLTDWRYLSTTPATGFFTLPPLPNDTVVVEQGPPNWTPIIIDSSLRLQPPARVLTWPDVTRVEIQSDRDLDTSIFRDPNLNKRIGRALSSNVYNLESTGLIKTTRYRMPDGARVTIWQGPRDLMRRSLRYSVRYAAGPNQAWTSSTPINIIIAGRQHIAWLLQDSATAALVVEVDDLLLYITGPNATYLKRQLLDELPKLEWEEVEVRG